MVVLHPQGTPAVLGAIMTALAVATEQEDEAPPPAGAIEQFRPLPGGMTAPPKRPCDMEERLVIHLPADIDVESFIRAFLHYVNGQKEWRLTSLKHFNDWLLKGFKDDYKGYGRSEEAAARLANRDREMCASGIEVLVACGHVIFYDDCTYFLLSTRLVEALCTPYRPIMEFVPPKK